MPSLQTLKAHQGRLAGKASEMVDLLERAAIVLDKYADIDSDGKPDGTATLAYEIDELLEQLYPTTCSYCSQAIEHWDYTPYCGPQCAVDAMNDSDERDRR